MTYYNQVYFLMALVHIDMHKDVLVRNLFLFSQLQSSSRKVKMLSLHSPYSVSLIEMVPSVMIFVIFLLRVSSIKWS